MHAVAHYEYPLNQIMRRKRKTSDFANGETGTNILAKICRLRFRVS